MKIYNGLVALLAVVISGVDSKLEVYTIPNATAYRGGKITLPCQFSGVPEAVYWYKHNRTGAPDDQKKLVVQYFIGQWHTGDDARYNITTDHSMVISDVQIEDETTYSCEVSVTGAPTGKNYTDLMVIALAEPLEPNIEGCEVTDPDHPGQCTYTFSKDSTQPVKLVCKLRDVRPPPDVMWTKKSDDSGDVRLETAKPQISETDGLSTILSQYQVPSNDLDYQYKCEAKGEAVNGSSSMTAAFKAKREGGLSGGGKAVISIFFVLIVIATVLGIIGYFVWKKRREHDDDDPEEEPLSPFQSEFEELAEKINDYKPGSFSGLEEKEGRSWPKVTRLGVFGVTHAGKSSLVRSLKFSLKGEFGAVEVAQSHSIGGVTVIPKPFALTKHISVVDNRGLKDLDVSCIKDIMDQIRGQSKILEGTVDFPILVFDARQPVNALDKFLPDFVKAIRGEFGSHPAIVFTHRDTVGDRMDTIKAQATGMGALDQKLYFIENFTKTPTEPCYEKRLELLRMLKTMLECADENLIERDNKKRRGNGATCGVQMDMADPTSTSGSKGFFGRFKRN